MDFAGNGGLDNIEAAMGDELAAQSGVVFAPLAGRNLARLMAEADDIGLRFDGQFEIGLSFQRGSKITARS